MDQTSVIASVGSTENDAQTIANLATRARPVTYVGAIPSIVLPAADRVASLEAFQDVPARIRQASAFTDVPSFVFFVNRFKSAPTLLFAHEAALACVAKLDHSNPGAPSWGTHDASVKFQLSREWQTWIAANGKRMDQVTFAEFLENNLPDIAEPAGAIVLEMARTLALVDTFTLGLPPFERSALYKVTARLRFRLQESKLALWFDLVRPQDVLRQAWDDAMAQIGTETALPVLNGTTTGQQPQGVK